MLSINEKISYNTSSTDTTWLKRPRLKAKKVFNRQISQRREALIEITCELSKKRSRKINELKDEKESAFN